MEKLPLRWIPPHNKFSNRGGIYNSLGKKGCIFASPGQKNTPKVPIGAINYPPPPPPLYGTRLSFLIII